MKRLSAAAAAAAILLIIVAVSSATDPNDAVSIWIPEHRCLEKSNISGKCNLYKCMQKCSGKPLGRGRCSGGNYCTCTYYCNGPPK